MQKILVPVDFSEGSLLSVKYAVFVAGNRKTDIHLFHIYSDMVIVPDSSFTDGMDNSGAFFAEDLLVSLKEQAEKNMTALKDEAQKFLSDKLTDKIKISTSLTGGDPIWEIEDTIENLKPDMVIMGTRGRGKKGFLEGSMAEKIMSKANIPVIAVPETYNNIRLKNILYATNFDNSDEDTINRIFHLFNTTDIKIFVTYFSPGEDANSENEKMERLKKLFKKKRIEDKIRFSIVHFKQKEETLETVVSFNKIDLIAFVSHKKNIFKNLFTKHLHKKDFFKLDLPMLALHTKD